MIRLPLVFVLALASAFGAGEAAGHGGELKAPSIWWKWANFAVLAGGLGYLISKYAGSYFESRRQEIQGGLREARKLREESEARVSEIEKRVAHLGADMEAMREAAGKEMAAEAERIGAGTRQALAKIQASAEREIASAVKFARSELKTYSGELAVKLAAVQVRDRIDPATQEKLVTNFVSRLEGARKPAK